MADIDKALPNEPRKTVNVPGEEEIQEADCRRNTSSTRSTWSS